MEETINKIAKEELGIDSLETQCTGDDFHEIAVWAIKKALEEAYNCGRHYGTAHAIMTMPGE